MVTGPTLTGLIMGVIALYIILIFKKLLELKRVTEKGNKDQQEIKTRLFWIRKGLNAIQTKFKVKG